MEERSIAGQRGRDRQTDCRDTDRDRDRDRRDRDRTEIAGDRGRVT